MKVGGGVTISTGGVTVDGLASVGGGVSISGSGLTVQLGGMNIAATQGATVFTSGMVITAGGASVGNRVSIVADGLTVLADGVKVTEGMVVTGGMTVYGDATVSISISLLTSDRRLKRDFMPIDDALAKVNKLNGVYFKWIQDEPNGIQFDDKRHVGLI
eukprot:gene6933-8312_t